MKLSHKKCVPCEGGIAKLTLSEAENLNSQLITPWTIEDEMKIVRSFAFNNFIETMQFVNKVAEIAEEEGHHPVMHVYYAKVDIELWTHAILGLSENDFILAAKIEEKSGHEGSNKSI